MSSQLHSVVGWRRAYSRPVCGISASRNGPAWRQEVFKSYPVETVIIVPAPRREQIATLIGNLSRTVDILTADIEDEEVRVGARDLLDPTYPVLARSLR